MTENNDSLRLYLKEIGRYPLLRGDETLTLAKQVQQSLDCRFHQSALIDTLNRKPTLSEWANHCKVSEAELKRILHLGHRAKQRLINCNLRLVVAIAKRYSNRGLPLVDLIQEGAIGLDRAVDRFDPYKGYQFSTYAYWWIRQAITRAIAKQSRTIRLPIYIREKLNKIKKAQQQLSQSLGRSPTLAEVSEVLHIDAMDLVQHNSAIRSIDAPMGEGDTTLLDFIADDTTLEDALHQQDLRDWAHSLLRDAKLSQREILIVMARCCDASLDQIAAHPSVKVSAARVSQIYIYAFGKLQRAANKKDPRRSLL